MHLKKQDLPIVLMFLVPRACRIVTSAWKDEDGNNGNMYNLALEHSCGERFSCKELRTSAARNFLQQPAACSSWSDLQHCSWFYGHGI